MATIGQVRVGRRIHHPHFQEPSYPGFTPIVVMRNTHSYGKLSPYCIRVPVSGFPDGVIHENYWQFLKVYPQVPPRIVTLSEKDKTIAWTHEGCIQVDDQGDVTPEWDDWRIRGFSSENFIRFPNGSDPKDRAACLYAKTLNEDGTVSAERLDLIPARKKNYVKTYCENVQHHSLFKQLQLRLLSGENLLIIEVDGPHQESLDYYKQKYKVGHNFIVNSTILVTVETMIIMINDPRHSFGHGYALASKLLGIEDQIINS